MKKFISSLLVFSMVLIIADTASAQNMFYNGKNVTLKFPRGIEASRNYTFPTFKSRSIAYDNDTVNISVTDLETYATCTGITGTTYALITVDQYVLAGAKLFVRFGNNDTVQTVFIKQGATVVDTVIVNSRNVCREYLYNGTAFVPVNSGFPASAATATQSSSITTGVSIASQSGVITTVSSTLAADASATFTVTNPLVRSGSVIYLTPEYTGNGFVAANVTAVGNGAFTVKITNVGTASLNAVIKLHYLVVNR